MRLVQGASYRDLSTIMVLPTRDGVVNDRVRYSLQSLIKPMNQGFYDFPMWNLSGFEVADAYNQAIGEIINHPDLSRMMFLLTVESDNLPPPDGLIRLLADMYAYCDKDADGKVILYDGRPKFTFGGIGGLYWTKGEGGMPMVYGNPKEFPANFRPQPVVPGTVQECRGIAQGFSLFSLDMFKDKRLGPPWFVTKQSWDEQKGIEMGTQDLQFCEKAAKLGYRFAVDTNVRVGHMDINPQSKTYGFVW